MIDFKGCNLQFAKAELAFRETKELMNDCKLLVKSNFVSFL